MINSTRRGSGRPLLLVHGLGSSLRTWDRIVPALSRERQVVSLDLPGFGRSAPLVGEVTVATLTDAVARFISEERLSAADLVGSCLGGRIVLELARRGHPAAVVALGPTGFWNDRELRIFGASMRATIAAVRTLRPVLGYLTPNPVGRALLLAQFSARPWAVPAGIVQAELRAITTSPSLDDALRSQLNGPRVGDWAEPSSAAGSHPARVRVGWGRRDLVTPSGQAARVADVFPGTDVHWFARCGHFPQWDQPEQTARFVLDSTRPD